MVDTFTEKPSSGNEQKCISYIKANKIKYCGCKGQPHGPESIVGVHDAVNHKVHHHEPNMRYNVFIR